MPELPEIEVLRRSLEPILVGRKIEAVSIRTPALREPLDRRRLRSLAGYRIVALRRRSKYLLVDLEHGRTLSIHLGMSGRLTVAPRDRPRESHEHLSFALDGGERLRLRDPRRFGLAFVASTAMLESDPHFAGLGREPLAPPLRGDDLRQLAAGRRSPLKAFLMDASRVVGVGNIYASEALFAARLRPDRSVATLRRDGFERLATAIVAVLERAIREGGTTLNDFTDGAGNAGSFQVSLSVYAREGEPCPRCGARIRRIVQSNRSTFFCARCQY